MESVRQSKVAKLLQKELAEIFRANAKTMFEDAFITVRVVPEITFFIDDSYDYAEKINALFNKPI